MIYVLIQIGITALNATLGSINYKKGNYKMACMSFFVAGLCFMGAIVASVKAFE